MKSLIKALNSVIRAAKMTPADIRDRSKAAGRILAESIELNKTRIDSGTMIGAIEMALLAGAGIDQVQSRSEPKVSCGFVGSKRIVPLIDALNAVCAVSTEVVEPMGESLSSDAAVEAALETDSDLVILFGGDCGATVNALKDRRCRILFDSTDFYPGGDAAAGQSKDNGQIILCLPSEPLLDAVLALELFMRPALRSMLRGYNEIAGLLRAELYCKGAIEPTEGKIRLVPVKFGYRDGTPRVEPTSGDGLMSLIGAGALIVVPPDAVPYDRYSIVEVIPLPLDDRYLV